MDANQKRAMVARVKRTMENLEKNGFSTAFVYTREEALTLLKSLVPEKSVTAAGGSMTLREIGALEYLEASTDFRKDYMEAYDADCYLLSANAITEPDRKRPNAMRILKNLFINHLSPLSYCGSLSRSRFSITAA